MPHTGRTIPAAYNGVQLYKIIWPGGRRQFNVFIVTRNGQTGYVGENGVEYFR